MTEVSKEVRRSRLKTIREHIKQESTQDLEGLLEGMTSDCLCAVNLSPRPFVGPKKVAERYLLQWKGFPDFKVRVLDLKKLGSKRKRKR